MLLFKSAFVVLCSTFALADYGGHNWGYKADIYHPAKHGYGHGGHSRVEMYQNMKPVQHYYHEKPMYKKPMSYHQVDDYYHAPQPKHYGYEKPMYNPMPYKPMPAYKEPMKPYYPPPPPPPKKEDDHMDMKFNVEIPLKKMFDKIMKKDDEPKPEPAGYGGGYGGYNPPPPKEEKKDFDIKIPKIDIEGIFDKMHGEQEEAKDEYKK